MTCPPSPIPAVVPRAYGFSRLFTELKISLATLLGGPIAGLRMLHGNFLELRDFDQARNTLVFGTVAILPY
jgi:hypothetical protein